MKSQPETLKKKQKNKKHSVSVNRNLGYFRRRHGNCTFRNILQGTIERKDSPFHCEVQHHDFQETNVEGILGLTAMILASAGCREDTEPGGNTETTKSGNSFCNNSASAEVLLPRVPMGSPSRGGDVAVYV